MSKRSIQSRSKRAHRAVAVGGTAAMLVMVAVPVSATAASASARHPSLVTNVVFWDWSPGQDRIVTLFNKTHSSIHVTLEDVGGGNAEYVKLADAVKSGTGIPDVAEMEYDEIPSFEITNSVANLVPYGVNMYKSDYPTWVWNDVSTGAGANVWAVPDDTGPLADLYNSVEFAKYNLTPPATWAQFATDAIALHKANPNAYITNFDAADLQWVLSLMAQDGAYPFTYTGGSSVGIDFTGPKQMAFAAYWDKLEAAHAVNGTSDVSVTSFTDMDNGTDALWLSSGWGPSYMQADLKATLGDWRSANLPQWTAGANVGANWGGSCFPVMAASKVKAAAATFAEFAGATLASWNVQVTAPTLNFPGFIPELNKSSFVNLHLTMSGSANLHNAFINSAKTASTVEWPPFMTEALTDSATAFANVMDYKQTLASAFASFQTILVNYAKSEGFKVTT
jgi:multiple sugar transport system substrate-binding protein